MKLRMKVKFYFCLRLETFQFVLKSFLSEFVKVDLEIGE
ncbi:hypothetical protein LEP1GSC043_4718 [Leptospira weilii str. Ecochallenge]|uniref:Uncharacterized protein n=1 Tax=Leptospira weilii str. Ecochallenge TaxID=1049986 RepID=N1U531_9LEPT|nr:hypothetical protein LEP1GSC043_4718 [Leptospira weilii str. Ecochallenge]